MDAFHYQRESTLFEDSMLTDANFLSDHVIISCLMDSSLLFFIQPLRSKRLTVISPILVMSPELPSDELWTQVSHYPQVYFIKVNAPFHFFFICFPFYDAK
jgi:hypothetical protein